MSGHKKLSINPRSGKERSSGESFSISSFDLKWITDEIDEKGIQFMESLGLHLCDKKNKSDNYPGRDAVTTSQMRNIFSEVKRIQVKASTDEQWENEASTNVLLLRPKIAYSTARVLSSRKTSRMKDLRTVLEKGLVVVKNKDDFKRFSQFLEGIIAYHKVYGGKD